MQESPLRERMDQHHREITGRLDRLENHLDRRIDKIESRFDDHTHNGRYVTWPKLISTLLTAGAIAAGVIQAL